MNLRQRTLLSVAVTLAGLMAGVYFVSSNFLLRKYEDLEREETARNLQRVADEFSYQLQEMHSNSTDWSNWDDTYRFMLDKNRAYINSNLTTLQLNLDSMVFLDAQGRVFYTQKIVRPGHAAPPSGEDIRHSLGFDGPANLRPAPGSAFCGLISLASGGAAMFSARPILLSTGKGAPHGWIVFALRIDDHVVSSLAERTHTKLELFDLKPDKLPADCKAALGPIRAEGSFVSPLNDNKIGAYSLLKDLKGAPLRVFRIVEPRAIYAEGLASQRYLIQFITITGMVFSLVIIWVLEFAALSRVSRLRLQVERMGCNDGDHSHITLSGHDELSWLARVIDGMVQGLRASKLELSAKNENLVATIQRLAATNHILANAVEGIADFDKDGRLVNLNSSFARMHGSSEESLAGLSWESLVAPEDHATVREAITTVAQKGKTLCEVRGRRIDGSAFHEEIVIVSAPGDEHVAATMHWFTKDISERKQLESEIQYQAYHDSLTGFPNRTLFVERLQMAHHRAKRRNEAIAVLFLDLDGFKLINDSLGHESGDQLLAGVANRIQHCVRPQDTVARMGGDEFTVLLDGLKSVDEAKHIADRIIEGLESPISLASGKAFVSASVGIALSLNGGEDAETLLQNADVAMYQAKATSKPSYAIFEPQMNAPAIERKDLAKALQRALEEDKLSLDYQPLFDLHAGRVTGVEALLRWRDPERGEVPPSLFISVAEELGMMEAVGTWSLRQACLQMREWLDALPQAAFTVNVNLSGKQIQRAELAQTVADALLDAGLPAEHLRLEVAAHLLGADIQRVSTVLNHLRKTGVRLALDDFGTGPHLISKLSDYPFDLVKIDGSLTGLLETHEEARAMVRAMFIMAESVKINVAAEGIETPGQFSFLRDLGCSVGQGFVFGRPLAPEQMLEALKNGIPFNKIDADFAA